mmetsp:Transcript_58696/g.143549  ORF Transcript_58696/g.143549 Transcript_58696/m.143549 type:complete len:706 (-) Transcript_58696:1425-3542(-)
MFCCYCPRQKYVGLDLSSINQLQKESFDNNKIKIEKSFTLAMKQLSDQQSFDYVIVGSGPSAIGLVYGLLQAHVTVNTNTRQGNKQNLGDRSSSPSPPTIAIIERGSGPPHHPTTSSPRDWYQASHHQQSSSVDLVISTITGRVMEIPVGKGIGGTSNINAGLCHPPTVEDCSGNSSCWPEPWRSSLYKEAQSLLQTLENNKMIYNYPCVYCNSDDNCEDDDGTTQSNLKFFPAVKTLAQPRPTKAGSNGDNNFRRMNYFDGLLEPLLMQHPYLEQQSINWFRGYEVQRILLDNGGTNRAPKVLGVECTRVVDDQSSKQQQQQDDEQFITIRSVRRTIVCAGALETPALLLVSFMHYIDENSILRSKPDNQNTKDVIPLSSSPSKSRNKDKKKKTLSGVGKGLKDQTILGRIFLKRRDRKQKSKRQILSTNGISDLSHLNVPSIGLNTGFCITNECFQVGIADKISYSFAPATLAIALRRYSPSRFWSKVFEWLSSTFESFLSFVLQRTPLGTILDGYSAATLLCFMHPKSSGSVKIAVKDSYINNSQVQQPLRRKDVTIVADPGYLSDSRDISALRNAWEHYGQTFGWEIFPGILFSILLTPIALFGLPTKSNWFDVYCRSFLLPYFHFAGSCSLQRNENNGKQNDDWVVEPARLQLRGFEGISICDASVFPSMVSNPPALTCATMGYILGKNLADDSPTIRKE